MSLRRIPIVERRPLLAFFGLAYGLSWAVWVPTAVASQRGLLADRVPLLILPGAFGPFLAALLVTALGQGRIGVRAWLGRLLRWRVGLHWYGVALLGPFALAFAALGLARLLGLSSVPPTGGAPIGLPDLPWYALVPLLVVGTLLGGPLPEEPGWRGYALPLLQARWSALAASLLLGALWAVWHAPLFWMVGAPQEHLSLPAFFLAALPLSVLFTWVYNNTRGSVLLGVLFHAAFNTSSGLWQGDPRATWLVAGLLWLVVLAVVWRYGARNLARVPLVRRGQASEMRSPVPLRKAMPPSRSSMSDPA